MFTIVHVSDAIRALARGTGGATTPLRHVVGAGDAVSNTHFEYLLWVTISTQFFVMMFVVRCDIRPLPRRLGLTNPEAAQLHLIASFG